MRVVIVLSSQPQREILRRLESIHAPLASSTSRPRTMLNAGDEERRGAEAERETVWLRQVAAQQIAAVIAAQQDAVSKAITATGGDEIRSFTAVNAISARVTRQTLESLAADPAVSEVVLDVRLAGGDASPPKFHLCISDFENLESRCPHPSG